LVFNTSLIESPSKSCIGWILAFGCFFHVCFIFFAPNVYRRSKLTIGKRVRQRMLFTRDEAVGYFTSTNEDMADWYHLNECMNPGMPILLPMREMNERGKAKTHWKEAMNEKRQRYKEVLQNASYTFDYYFFADVDIACIEDPRPHLKRVCEETNKALLFSYDRLATRAMSGGFVLICDPKHKIIDDYLSAQETRMEQKFLSDLELQWRHSGHAHDWGTLDEHIFANGYLMTTKNNRLQEIKCFHVNYCSSLHVKAMKLKFMVNHFPHQTELQKCAKKYFSLDGCDEYDAKYNHDVKENDMICDYKKKS